MQELPTLINSKLFFNIFFVYLNIQIVCYFWLIRSSFLICQFVFITESLNLRFIKKKSNINLSKQKSYLASQKGLEILDNNLKKEKIKQQNKMSQQVPTIPATSYSTIFHCDQNTIICSLRAIEGIIATAVFIQFLLGYKKMIKQQNNPISKQDKNIYMLAMWQTLFLSFYYLLFEQFVILATIRNFLIWIAINILHVMCKIYWLNDQKMLKKIKYAINTLKTVNILSWFVFSLGQGSAVFNTDFNLGYNCRLVGWTILSGFLLIVVTLEAYIGVNIYDKLQWEKQNTHPDNKQALESIKNESFEILALIACNFTGAFIMFVWDFYAYVFSNNDVDCTDIFAGNTFFRQVLCFLLKLITMQLTPSMIYYIIYQRRKNQFFQNFKQENQQDINVDLLEDNASQFNRTLASRVDSRKSLFSQHNPHGGSQYF